MAEFNLSSITNVNTYYKIKAQALAVSAIASELVECKEEYFREQSASHFTWKYTVAQDSGDISLAITDTNGTVERTASWDTEATEEFMGETCSVTVKIAFSGHTKGPKAYILVNDTQVYSLPSQTYTASYTINNVKDGDVILIKNESTCFPAGTPVLMSDGSQKVIETIEVGDKVQSFNIDTYEYIEGTVEEVVTGYTTRMGMILADNDLYLAMAEGHPVYTTEGYKTLCVDDEYPMLEVGDRIITAQGYATITNAQVVDCEPTQVYSLRISGGIYFSGHFVAVAAVAVPTHS